MHVIEVPECNSEALHHLTSVRSSKMNADYFVCRLFH